MSEVQHGLKRVTRQSLRQALAHFTSGDEKPPPPSLIPTTDAPPTPPPSASIELMGLDELLSLEGYLHKHAVSPFSLPPPRGAAPFQSPRPSNLLLLSLVWTCSGCGQGSLQPCVWWCACVGRGLGLAALALPLTGPTRQTGPPRPPHIPDTGTPNSTKHHILEALLDWFEHNILSRVVV